MSDPQTEGRKQSAVLYSIVSVAQTQGLSELVKPMHFSTQNAFSNAEKQMLNLYVMPTPI